MGQPQVPHRVDACFKPRPVAGLGGGTPAGGDPLGYLVLTWLSLSDGSTRLTRHVFADSDQAPGMVDALVRINETDYALVHVHVEPVEDAEASPAEESA
jgi:hypothetical protein